MERPLACHLNGVFPLSQVFVGVPDGSSVDLHHISSKDLMSPGIARVNVTTSDSASYRAL